MSVKFQFRRDTSEQWQTVDPILADGEVGLDTTVRAFKIGNGISAWSALPWAIQGARIDDAISNLDSTWSSEKISQEMADLEAYLQAAITNVSRTPVLSTTSVTGNEGTSTTVLISDYSAAISYTVSSSDPGAVTATHSAGVITLNLIPQASGNKSAVVSVIAMEPGKAPSPPQIIEVTVVNVTVEDSAIQIVSFQPQESYNNGWKYP